MPLKADEGGELTAQAKRTSWTALLSSVPHLRRLSFDGSMDALLSVLPLHLPLLDHLSLSLSEWASHDENPYNVVAHPTIRVLELGYIQMQPPLEEEVRAWMGSARFPKLEHYIRRPTLPYDQG
jgi:hypothetical protein